MIVQVFGDDCRMALAISQAENGTRQCDRVSKPNSNGSYDIGVFQINTIHTPSKGNIKQLKECMHNIKVAKQIFDAQGWSPWSVYKSGKYKQYVRI